MIIIVGTTVIQTSHEHLSNLWWWYCYQPLSLYKGPLLNHHDVIKPLNLHSIPEKVDPPEGVGWYCHSLMIRVGAHIKGPPFLLSQHPKGPLFHPNQHPKGPLFHLNQHPRVPILETSSVIIGKSQNFKQKSLLRSQLLWVLDMMTFKG